MRRFSLWVAVILCAQAMQPVRCAGETTEAKTPAAGDASAAKADQPKPEDVLRKMADYIGNLPAFSCQLESKISVDARGMSNQMASKSTLRLEKPNRFAVIVDEGEMGLTLVTDGEQMVEYFPPLNRYVVKDPPSDLSQLGSAPEFSVVTMGMGAAVPVSAEEFYKQLMTGVTGSEYVGVEKLDDVTCDHLRFQQEQFDWDIWIEQGERPVIRRIAPDMSKRFVQAGEGAQDIKVEMTVLLSNWNVDPKFTDADFAFVPPAGAEKVETLFGRAEREEAPHPLLGQPAPTFKTVDLEQKEINLSDHLGKDVVILDFWATWCGPCVRAMPIISEVAGKFKDRGVVFYAVNVREDVETISEFLKAQELVVPVAMDLEGTIGDLYKVEGIPQTVLIGKDGKVQVVHIGFSTGIGEELTKQLEDLLAGKDLASDVLAEAEKARQARAERAKSTDTASGAVESDAAAGEAEPAAGGAPGESN